MSELGSQLSKFSFYSYGIVAANKERGSNEVLVTPVEDLPFIHGAITGSPTQYNASVKSSDGGVQDTSIQVSESFPAYWLPLGDSNRLTPPDVRRGEPVVILRFGDSKLFFWMTTTADLKFRRRETVIYGICVTGDVNAEPGPDNTYTVELNGHEKRIRLLTTQADGEPFKYDITLDTKNGSFTIADYIGNTKGNEFYFNSKTNQCGFKNAVGSFFDLTQHIFKLFAQEHVGIETPDMLIKADKLHVQAETTHDGDINHKGEYTQKGNHSVEGNMAVLGGGTTTLSGNLKGQANIDLDGKISADFGEFRSGISAPNVRYK